MRNRNTEADMEMRRKGWKGRTTRNGDTGAYEAIGERE